MRLQLLPEIVGTERRVSEVVRQRIPGHRTGDGERPTAERAATMSWYNKMVEAGTSKSLTTGNARWYGIVEFNVPLDTYRSFRRQFYESHDATNSVIALKDDG